MKKVIMVSVLIVAAHLDAHAETFDFLLYQLNPENRQNPTGDFFEDYILKSRCEIKIVDTALTPNAFIDITSTAFEIFQCLVAGNDKTYSFDAGSEIAVPDFITGIDASTQFGLRLDGNGSPLRFDSPQVSTSNGFGLFDESYPEEAIFGDTTGSFLQLWVQSRFDVPFGVLLEPARIGSTLRPRGTITSRSDLIESGKEFALLNGDFDFIEQSYRDGPFPGDFGEEIQNPARFNGYVTFDEKLSNESFTCFYVNGINTEPSEAYAQAALLLESFVQPHRPEVRTIITNYNRSRAPLADFAESFKQKRLLQYRSALRDAVMLEDIGVELDSTEIENIIERFFDLAPAEASLRFTRSELEFLLLNEFKDHVNRYLAVQSNRSAKALVFAYSQGNLFTNIALQFIDDVSLVQIRVVSIANPDDRVGRDDNGQYVTTFEDELIEAIKQEAPRFELPPPLRPNLSNFGVSRETVLPWDGHGLVTDYANPSFPSFDYIKEIVSQEIDNLMD